MHSAVQATGIIVEVEVSFSTVLITECFDCIIMLAIVK